MLSKTIPNKLVSIFSAGFFTIILFAFTNFSRAAEGDSLFSGIQVHTLNIRFSIPNYWDSLVYYYNQGDEQYIPATIIANGITIDNVGVRLKGNSSYTHPNNKKSFRLSFNEYVSGQRWNGLKGVHLNNFWNDPTFIREKLHLDFCQDAGIAAPRSNFVRLSINDTLFAFYSLVEHVDKTFLNSRFGEDEGDQFKAVDAYGSTSDILSDFRWMGNDSTSYLNHYELKSDEDTGPWRKLISLIDTLNHSGQIASSISSKVNLVNYYKAMAADILLGNMDSYVYNSRNFYIYFLPPAYKMEWIVWDASLSFGALPGGPSNIESLPVNYVSSDTGRPMFSKIVNTPSLNNEYLNAFCNLANTYFSSARLFPKIDSIANVIRSYVYEDPRKMYSNQQFETNIISDIIVSGSRKPGLKSFINLRKSNVQSQLNTLGINCDVGISNENNIVGSFELYQNYPNPFNPGTRIGYELSQKSIVSLEIFDAAGRLISSLFNGEQSSGTHFLNWNASSFPSGIYFYKITVAPESGIGFSETKKMTLIK